MENTRKNNEPLTTEVSRIGERLRGALEEGRENGQEAWNKIQERGREAAENARKLVQKHPGKAVGLALFIGAALGALVSFRRRST